MRQYELERVERYAITASSLDEAVAILSGLDSSAAYRVEIRPAFASAELEEPIPYALTDKGARSV